MVNIEFIKETSRTWCTICGFEKSLTVYKKDEPEFPISLKKGFRFFLWIKNLLIDNKFIPLKGQIVE
ncbi:hypothetical protein Bmyc01_42410 [Bacillus mycoides]|uniref:hypothetical protein n=1 Tax=Bacillus proteolyticus TaxID=2026192 RepID=UPI0024A0112C|nr:hypothetical protein [Bacillus proteolyticus]GLV65572.1 hypothetical protein Bmyc01_42410 [Bacillus mycoides]